MTLIEVNPDDERISKSLHGLSCTLIANMVIGVTEGLQQDPEIVRVWLPCVVPRVGVWSSRWASATRCRSTPGGHHLRRGGPTKFTVRHRQTTGWARWLRTSANCVSPIHYKAKGIRYSGEQIRRKAGKAGK